MAAQSGTYLAGPAWAASRNRDVRRGPGGSKLVPAQKAGIPMSDSEPAAPGRYAQPDTPRPGAPDPGAPPDASLDDPMTENSRLLTESGEFSAYPPIADYGFVSDCEVTALVAPSGAIEWMCLPRMDCPSVFGAMLDRGAGFFRFGPEDVDVPADRRYLPGTLVLETSWDCGEGWIIVRDCLVMGPWRHEHPESTKHIRPPTDYDAEHILLRTVRSRTCSAS